jgi:hypothetical protein
MQQILASLNRSTLSKTVTGIALALLLVAGCSDDETTKPPDEFAPPTNLTFVNGDNRVDLDWDPSPDATWDSFVGYNVYRHTESLAGVADADLAQYRIVTRTASQTSYSDIDAVNGTMYYYTVRGARDNGDLTQPTNEIDTAARPEGLVTLFEFEATGPSGFDLSDLADTALTMTSNNPDNTGLVDFYLGTTGENDESDQPLALKSPHLLGGSWTRMAAFKALVNPTDSQTTSTGFQLESITMGATVEEISDRVIVVRTPQENGEFHYGKLAVITTSGDAGDRRIQFQWTFQLIPNYPRF